MTRGNQREVDRKRAQARAAKGGKDSASKKAADGMTHQQRAERDAAALREKQARKAAMKAAAGGAGGSSGGAGGGAGGAKAGGKGKKGKGKR